MNAKSEQMKSVGKPNSRKQARERGWCWGWRLNRNHPVKVEKKFKNKDGEKKVVVSSYTHSERTREVDNIKLRRNPNPTDIDKATNKPKDTYVRPNKIMGDARLLGDRIPKSKSWSLHRNDRHMIKKLPIIEQKKAAESTCHTAPKPRKVCTNYTPKRPKSQHGKQRRTK